MDTISRKLTVGNNVLKEIDAKNKYTLNVGVSRIVTDSNGQILDQNLLPDNVKLDYPFYLFGENDRLAGFPVGQLVTKDESEAKLFSTYVHGTNSPLFFFNPGATINSRLKTGDFILLYVDDLNAPNYFIFIIVRGFLGGYVSLSAQTMVTQLDENGWNAFKMWNFKYAWENDAQLYLPFFTIKHRFDSGYKSDSFIPEQYREIQAQKADTKIIEIPLEAGINQYFGFAHALAWENNYLNLSFNLYF